jgi:hypothetical protein
MKITGLDEVILTLKTMNHKDLIELSKEMFSVDFNIDSKVRELAMKLSNNFHMGFLSLIGEIAKEVTNRLENELKDTGKL